MSLFRFLAASILGIAFVPSISQAQNLLQNGGFESSTFTTTSAQNAGSGLVRTNNPATDEASIPNWTWTADPTASGYAPYVSNFILSRTGTGETNTVVDGTLAVVFGAGSYSGGGSIKQNFTPTAGTLYIVNLSALRIGGGEAISGLVTITNNVNNATVATMPINMSSVGSQQWKQFTFTFTAPSNNLSFTFADTTVNGAAGSTDLGLDAISIQAASTQTLTILGGSGTAGSFANNTEFSVDNGATWHQAYLAGQHPWGNITGTNTWINQAPNLTTGLNLTTLFRIKFTAPAIMASPGMTFSINADNIGAMSINGHTLQSTVGGYPPYPVYNLGAGFIVPGENVLTIALTDQGGLVGINYRIDLTVIASQPITVVQLPPVIVAPSPINGQVGSAFGYQVNASNNPTSYSASGLPGNLSINSGGGFISGTPTVAGSFSVGLAASNNAGTGSASTVLAIARGPATFTFSNLARTYTGSALSPTVTTNPSNLGFSLTYSGPTSTPTNAGSYPFVATITDSNYSGTASNTFTITRAPATVTLSNLAQGYDGNPKPVTVTTVPAGLATSVTYKASTVVPSGVGSYPIVATVTNSNYTGSAIGTLTISDVTKPVLSLPANIVVEATSSSGAVVTFAATANDDVSGSVPVTLTPASGSMFALGTTPVNASSTDAANNTATGSFSVTIQDTTPPTLSLPADQTLEATGPAGAIATFTVSGSDAVSAVTTATSVASGTTFALGTTTVTATGTDAAGNAANGSFTITVKDTTPPVITQANLVTEATSPLGAVVNFAPTATDIVSGNVAVSSSIASGSTFAVGTTVVTLAATDAAGNVGTLVFSVTVTDTTAPIIAAQDNLIVEATSAVGAVVTFTPSASDAVSGPVGVTASPASGSTFALGTTLVTLTTKDAAGNAATSSFTVTVVDTTAPVIAAPAAITAEATSPAGATVTFSPSANDLVDGAVNVVASPASGSTFALGTTNVTLTSVDARGNSATSSFSVSVVDTTAPVLTTPVSQTLEATSAAGATATFAASATDAVGATIAYSIAPGSTFALGTTTVNVTATDAAGNQSNGSFAITVRDTTAPVIAVPANIITEATSAAGAVATFSASATDIVDGNVVVTSSIASGSTFALGTTAVTLTATDAAGNTAKAVFSVTVSDTTAPIIAPQDNLIVEATSAAGAVVTFTPSSLDIVSGAVSVVSAPASGSTFALGTTLVTLTAKDAAGNSASATFTVTVVDTTAPVIATPANIVAEATSAAGAVVTFNPSANDSVSGAVAVAASTVSGSVFPIGTTTVTVTTHDAAGNAASSTFKVTVRDTIAPVIGAVANQTLEATGPNGAIASYVVTATDAVGATVSYAPAPGSVFALGTTTVTVTAQDAAANTSTKTFTVTVRDTTTPALSLPASQTLEATSPSGATATFSASANDIVSGNVPVSFTTNSGSTFAIGTTSVTATAADAAHNVATGSFTITVRDTTAPVLTVPANQTIEATSAAGAVATFTATATDAVGATLTYSKASGSTFALGTTTVTVTAKDAAGNTTTKTFTITVRDTTAPTITSLTANPASLWPPNHKMVDVTLTAVVSDVVDASAITKIVSVTSNEAVQSKENGDQSPDWLITGNLTLQLRAERFGTGNGRIYTITVQSTDTAGNVSTKVLTVGVPKDQSGK